MRDTFRLDHAAMAKRQAMILNVRQTCLDHRRLSCISPSWPALREHGQRRESDPSCVRYQHRWPSNAVSGDLSRTSRMSQGTTFPESTSFVSDATDSFGISSPLQHISLLRWGSEMPSGTSNWDSFACFEPSSHVVRVRGEWKLLPTIPDLHTWLRDRLDSPVSGT